jgi:hypothetical protein
LEAPEGKEFNSLIQEWALKQQKILQEESDPVKLHQAQGAFKILDSILKLPDAIKEAMRRQQEGGKE